MRLKNIRLLPNMQAERLRALRFDLDSVSALLSIILQTEVRCPRFPCWFSSAQKCPHVSYVVCSFPFYSKWGAPGASPLNIHWREL